MNNRGSEQKFPGANENCKKILEKLIESLLSLYPKETSEVLWENVVPEGICSNAARRKWPERRDFLIYWRQ